MDDTGSGDFIVITFAEVMCAATIDGAGDDADPLLVLQPNSSATATTRALLNVLHKIRTWANRRWSRCTVFPARVHSNSAIVVTKLVPAAAARITALHQRVKVLGIQERLRLQLHLHHALFHLSIKAELVAAMARQRAIRVIATAFQKHLQVQLNDSLASRNSHYDMILLEDSRQSGDVYGIVTVMQAHLHNPIVQTKGCMALCSLASASGAANQDWIGREGGYGPIMMAMRLHEDDYSLQIHGCTVLSLLASCNEGNRVLIAQEGGIGVIALAMQRFVRLPQIQEVGCRALGQLAVNEGNRILIARGGGLTTIMTALWEHLEVQSVQEEGLWALCGLSINEDNSLLMAQGGAVGVVLVSMQKYRQVTIIQVPCCSILRNLLKSRARNIMAEGAEFETAIEAIKDAMTANMHAPVIQRLGQECLAILKVKQPCIDCRISKVAANSKVLPVRSQNIEKQSVGPEVVA